MGGVGGGRRGGWTDRRGRDKGLSKDVNIFDCPHRYFKCILCVKDGRLVSQVVWAKRHRSHVSKAALAAWFDT